MDFFFIFLVAVIPAAIKEAQQQISTKNINTFSASQTESSQISAVLLSCFSKVWLNSLYV